MTTKIQNISTFKNLQNAFHKCITVNAKLIYRYVEMIIVYLFSQLYIYLYMIYFVIIYISLSLSLSLSIYIYI